MADIRGRAQAFAKEAGGMFLTTSDYTSLQNEIVLLQKQVAQLTEERNELEEELKTISEVQGYQREVSPAFNRLQRKWKERALRHSHP